ncbi:MAG: thioesterase [Ignavibacteriaceae bacterium]
MNSSSWKETFHIHSNETDMNGNAHPHALFNYMLDSASSHVIDSQFSYEALLGEGRLWVLSRFFVVYHKIPKWKDEVIVETWGKGIDKLFGLRDFTITSLKGEKYAAATSAWLLIDRKSSRPQRLDTLRENFPFLLNRNELDVKLEKLPPISPGNKKSQYLVHFTDIDINKHVSSSKYMQWIINSFPHEILKENMLSSFEINYLAEAMIDEKVSVFTEKSGEYYLCEINRDSDNTVICRAKLKWNNPG